MRIANCELNTTHYAPRTTNYDHAPFAIIPPSMLTYSPVINEALSLARKSTTLAIGPLKKLKAPK